MNGHKEDELVWGEYRDTSDGPAVVLTLTSRASACWLRGLLIGMTGSNCPRELAAERGVRLSNFDGLELRTVRKSYWRNVRRGKEGLAFVWACTDDEWQTNAELLDPFCEGQSGHQYLTAHGSNDATIEVRLGERGRLAADLT